MSLSDKELKLLWTPTGNLCAFPGCTQALIEENVVVGQMCHIYGEKPGSNRFDSLKPSDFVNGSHENRIVLCPTHHTIIDKPELEAKYSVELLTRWKTDHTLKNSQNPFPANYMALVQEQLRSSVSQVAINSPGSIQALGDVTIHQHHSPPLLTLLGADGDNGGSGIFGKTAVLLFGAKPDGALVNVVLEITVEGTIDSFNKSVVGAGFTQDTTSIGPEVDVNQKRFVWGQHVLNAGNALRVEFHSHEPLGRIHYVT